MVRRITWCEFPVRFTPSGGGLQPWEVYVVVNNVERLAQGLYHYRAPNHSLELLQRGQMRSRMVELGFGVEYLHYASFICVVTCVPERFYWKYGVRGYRTAHIDVGVLVQSMWYVATALQTALPPDLRIFRRWDGQCFLDWIHMTSSR